MLERADTLVEDGSNNNNVAIVVNSDANNISSKSPPSTLLHAGNEFPSFPNFNDSDSDTTSITPGAGAVDDTLSIATYTSDDNERFVLIDTPEVVVVVN